MQALAATPPQLLASTTEAACGEDRIADLAKEFLALVFGLLSSDDRKRSSIGFRRCSLSRSPSTSASRSMPGAPLLADEALPHFPSSRQRLSDASSLSRLGGDLMQVRQLRVDLGGAISSHGVQARTTGGGSN